jgi:hypothetical protein
MLIQFVGSPTPRKVTVLGPPKQVAQQDGVAWDASDEDVAKQACIAEPVCRQIARASFQKLVSQHGVEI